jgi:ferredoxin--NADP+ reductase
LYKILEKDWLNSAVVRMVVEAPLVARKAEPGQFIIFRVDERGERIPLTIADCSRELGTVTIIFQIVGESTKLLSTLDAGEGILDFAGPLGNPSDLAGVKSACVVGGGVGCAIAYPQAKSLFLSGAETDVIIGFRTKDLVILESEFLKHSTNLFVATDDGAYKRKGFVTDILEERIASGKKYDMVVAIGPVMMMKAVCDATKKRGIKTVVSLNPIMIDGTGMCGGCRVSVGGKQRFACIDGPDFDGHEIDFLSLQKRNSFYSAYEGSHRENCRLLAGK